MEVGDQGQSFLRIGELSHRVGVSTGLLRAWERRYGLLSPARTDGGFRLYGEEDERRVRRMLTHLEHGVAAAEAARLARDDDATSAGGGNVASASLALGGLADRLGLALDGFDEAGAQVALDRLLAGFSTAAVLRDTILPYLHELGACWARGERSIAQEHFATAILRGRLLGLARGWGGGTGPRALLACLPGDQHDLGLICFGLALREHGWAITFLGPDTPLATIDEAARLLRPASVVLSATVVDPESLRGVAETARHARVAIGGAGADAETTLALGAAHLDGDPITAAAAVASTAVVSRA